VEKPNSFQFQHTEYKHKRVSKGGSKVWVDVEGTPFHKAYNRGKLTDAQFEAAKAFEKRYLAVWFRKSAKNLLDPTPTGSSGLTNQEAAIRAKERLEEVEEAMTYTQLNVVISVCVDHKPIGQCEIKRRRYRYLVEGLDEIALVLRLSR